MNRGVVVLVVLCLLTGVVLGGVAAGGCRPQLAGGPGEPGGDSPGTDPETTEPGDPGGPGTTEPPTEDTLPCPLCGEKVAEAAVLHRPLAVVIDNLAAARPQSGLSDACLVYELLVEGGITRFVVFFLHNESAAIGPVRSLRPYFLDLTMPLGAVVAHSGGSPGAFKDLEDLKPTAMHIDEMSYSSAFWRSNTRRVPHNLYTGTSLLREASRSLGYEGRRLSTTTPLAFNFAPEPDKVALPAGQSVTHLTLHYSASGGGYSVTYDYDSDTGEWMRYVGGAAQADPATGRQLRAATVIVQYVTSRVITGDPEGRLEFSMTGSGDATVFCQGRSFRAKWSKPARTSVLSYTDLAGNPLTLPPGPVWVLVASPGTWIETQ